MLKAISTSHLPPPHSFIRWHIHPPLLRRQIFLLPFDHPQSSQEGALAEKARRAIGRRKAKRLQSPLPPPLPSDHPSPIPMLFLSIILRQSPNFATHYTVSMHLSWWSWRRWIRRKLYGAIHTIDHPIHNLTHQLLCRHPSLSLFRRQIFLRNYGSYFSRSSGISFRVLSVYKRPQILVP